MLPSTPEGSVLAASMMRGSSLSSWSSSSPPQLESWLRVTRCLAGGAAFLFVVTGSHLLQFRLGMSVNSVLAPAGGLLTVGLGSLSAAFVADETPGAVCSALGWDVPKGMMAPTGRAGAAATRGGAAGGWAAAGASDEEVEVMRVVRTAVLGALLFKGLGGSFRGIAPSDICRPGAFFRRRGSLPAGMDYASPLQKRRLDRFGLLYGCHSCGRRQAGDYIGDHMPPRKVAAQMSRRWWRRLLRLRVTQRFAPQCRPCSSIQSTAVREGKRVLVRHHWASLRRYHATGAVAEGCRVMLGDELLDDSFRDVVSRVARFLRLPWPSSPPSGPASPWAAVFERRDK